MFTGMMYNKVNKYTEDVADTKINHWHLKCLALLALELWYFIMVHTIWKCFILIGWLVRTWQRVTIP